MICIYHADTLVDAQVVADCLAGNGIPCEIFQQNAVGAVGELPVIGPEVWIKRNTDADAARKLVCELELAIQRTADAPPRNCGQCGESSPAGFDICWRCGVSL
jgi:hypothetical protein